MSPELGREKVSLTHGYWFYFEDEGTQIVAFASALSGKEVVFVDDEIVSSKHSFRLKATHSFEHKASQYKVTIALENLFTGTLSCSLYKESELVSTTHKSYSMKTSNWKTFYTAMAFGAVCGYGTVWLIHRLS